MRLADLSLNTEYNIQDSEDDSTYKAFYMGKHLDTYMFEVSDPGDSDTLSKGLDLEFDITDIVDGLVKIEE